MFSPYADPHQGLFFLVLALFRRMGDFDHRYAASPTIDIPALPLGYSVASQAEFIYFRDYSSNFAQR
jgi:hypothetical protein